MCYHNSPLAPKNCALINLIDTYIIKWRDRRLKKGEVEKVIK